MSEEVMSEWEINFFWDSFFFFFPLSQIPRIDDVPLVSNLSGVSNNRTHSLSSLHAVLQHSDATLDTVS